MENKFYNELRKFSKAEKLKLGIVEDVDKIFNETKQVTKEFKATQKKLSDIAADKNKNYLN